MTNKQNIYALLCLDKDYFNSQEFTIKDYINYNEGRTSEDFHLFKNDTEVNVQNEDFYVTKNIFTNLKLSDFQAKNYETSREINRNDLVNKNSKRKSDISSLNKHSSGRVDMKSNDYSSNKYKRGKFD